MPEGLLALPTSLATASAHFCPASLFHVAGSAAGASVAMATDTAALPVTLDRAMAGSGVICTPAASVKPAGTETVGHKGALKTSPLLWIVDAVGVVVVDDDVEDEAMEDDMVVAGVIDEAGDAADCRLSRWSSTWRRLR